MLRGGGDFERLGGERRRHEQRCTGTRPSNARFRRSYTIRSCAACMSTRISPARFCAST
jgi:hypothetical protein